MPADKDWTTPTARAELAVLHAESTRGDDGWTVTEGQTFAYRVVSAGQVVATCDRLAAETDRRNAACIAADHNAVPTLLARIERDAVLLAQCAAVASEACWVVEPHVMPDGDDLHHAAKALHVALRAAGFVPENIADDTGEGYCTDYRARPVGEAVDPGESLDLVAACERIKRAVASGRLTPEQAGAAVGIRAAIKTHRLNSPDSLDAAVTCGGTIHCAVLAPAGGSDGR